MSYYFCYRVLISAVDKSNDKLEVCWFNNCLNNRYSGGMDVMCYRIKYQYLRHQKICNA